MRSPACMGPTISAPSIHPVLRRSSAGLMSCPRKLLGQVRALEMAQEALNDEADKLALKFSADLPKGMLATSHAAEIAALSVKGLDKDMVDWLSDVDRTADTKRFIDHLKLEAETLGQDD